MVAKDDSVCINTAESGGISTPSGMPVSETTLAAGCTLLHVEDTEVTREF